MSGGINFIKSIGQLITGGIGIVDGALVYKDEQGDVKEIGNVPVLNELPEADASKAGQQFWLNGTLWTYAKAGQFGTLEAGEPWPVKGYKEIVFETFIVDDFIDSFTYIKSDIGEVATSLNGNSIIVFDYVSAILETPYTASSGSVLDINESFVSAGFAVTFLQGQDGKMRFVSSSGFDAFGGGVSLGAEIRLYPPTS